MTAGATARCAEITPANVSRLRPVWVFSTGEARPHESAPIVNGGVMFVTSPNGQVIAIDARTGTLLWRYRRPRPEGASVLHDTNRGVALYGDKVYSPRARPCSSRSTHGPAARCGPRPWPTMRRGTT